MNEMISVKQLPIIEEQLRALGAQIDIDLAEATSLVCAEETVKEIKKVRTRFKKDFEKLEAERKSAKNAIMAPYDAFELIYKEFVTSKYTAADSKLKAAIDNTEDALKGLKKEDVVSYFFEYVQSAHIDWLLFEDVGLNITLTASVKSLKEQVKAYVDGIRDDLTAIETHASRDEVLVEYKATKSLSKSIAILSERHAALERATAEREAREAAKQAEQVVASAVEVLAPPVVLSAPVEVQTIEPTMKLVFSVTDTRSRLQALKKFLDDGGYTYE